jgi:hypothetical protein
MGGDRRGSFDGSRLERDDSGSTQSRHRERKRSDPGVVERPTAPGSPRPPGT